MILFQLIYWYIKERIFYDIKNPKGVENTIINKGKMLYG
jgi:hypothetical protein